ncbi:hypothetical protein QYE76_027277 [Lolium multiflorum]|uniref:Aminotransferase-like plant mobile domain-containing protein n=1 Tax=Lolium multiflorum TaxID=4521 RepID=A0AAD8PJ10_LOLMU|nr:hypothetical protein QYE76_027277 [Lolium multiflorum]
MTPTLQDVSMILGLPIQGEPLCMNTASDGWREQMANLIGMAPPAPENPKERAPAGAPFAWITNFGELLPEGAERDTIRTYTRVYLWYMLSRTLFADSGGKLAHWCWLKALTVLERRWSWGTAALAYLYRQLDEACRRTGSRTGSGGIGGCLLLLSVWSWDRLSVGRPRILTARPWPHYRHNLDREPTWAYLWDNVSEMTSDPKIMYRHYTEELDTLTAEQVDWEPYGTYYRIGAGMADLNPKCLEEARFWRMRCPLICMWLVEYHQPHRVMRQFGLYQRSEIQKTAEECETVWDQSHTDDKPIGPMRHFIKNTAQKMRRLANLLGCRDTEIAATSSSEEAEIPDDDTILSQGKKKAKRSAYKLKPRGNAPKRYTPDDYVNRGKKVVIEEDETPPRRSTLRKMRNDEPLSSEEEEEEEQGHQEQQEQQEQEQQPRQRTKRLAVRKQPARRGRRGG